MDMPVDNKCYKDVDYWNKRFEVEESFEWCNKYEDIKHLIEQAVHKTDHILMLGKN